MQWNFSILVGKSMKSLTTTKIPIIMRICTNDTDYIKLVLNHTDYNEMFFFQKDLDLFPMYNYFINPKILPKQSFLQLIHFLLQQLVLLPLEGDELLLPGQLLLEVLHLGLVVGALAAPHLHAINILIREK